MINAELTFIDDAGRLLVITPSAVKKLQHHRQINLSSTEAAGVLIGERRGLHLVIHDISEPGKGDIRGRRYVDRRGKHHQAAVVNAFVRSSGKLQYLGEWHSHPEDRPSPSLKDLGTWRLHLVATEQMALIIIGRCQMWAGKKIGDDIFTLQKI